MQCEIDDVLATTETSRNDHSSETTTFLHAGMHRLPEHCTTADCADSR